MRALATILALTMTAAAPRPVPTSPARAVVVAAADVARLPVADQPYYRYFWAGTVPARQMARFRAAFRLHLNLLSRESEIADVVEVTADVWRLDTRDLEWDLSVLENAAKIDPFFHTKITLGQDSRVITYWPGGVDPAFGKEFKAGSYGTARKKGDVIDAAAPWLPTKEILYLRKALVTEVPILNAQWFLVQSARQVNLNNKQTGMGYYDFLKIKNRDDFFKLVALDVKKSKVAKKEIRAALEASGVSPLNRQVVRFQSLNGGAWVTLDVTDQTGKGNAVRNLEGYRHQAEEWYGVLPNYLPATFLSDDKGVSQAFAPADNFGFTDDSSLREGRDGRIHVNLACIRCHAGDVLKPIDDYVRRTFRTSGPLSLQSADKKKYLKLKRQYLSDLGKYLKKDISDYTEAFTLATVTVSYPKGMTPGEAAKAYAEAFHAYADRPLSLADAARELGTTPERWKAALVKYVKATGQLDLEFATWLDDEPGKLTRVAWEDSYQLAQSILLDLVPLEKAKVK